MTEVMGLSEALEDIAAEYEREIQAVFPDVTVGMASADDLDALDALNRLVVETGPPGQIMRQRRSFFEPMVCEPENFTVALRDRDRRLIGYSVGCLCTADRRGFGRSPTVDDTYNQIGLLFGTALDPHYRGAGLQRLLVRLRLAIIGRAGRAVAQATAPPSNPRSLANMMKCGFRVIGAALLLDNQPRFIVEAPARDGLNPWNGVHVAPSETVRILTAEFDRHREAMRQFGRPTGWTRHDDGLALIYGAKAGQVV